MDYDDDGQYREDPTQYYRSESSAQRPSSNHHAASFGNFNSRSTQPQYHAPAPAPVHHNPAPVHHAPAPVHQAYHHAAAPRQDPNQFRGHPASNIDINSGSYTISYSG